MRSTRRFASLFALVASSLLAGCGGDEAVTELTISPDFVRAPSAGATATAGYLTITTPTDDRLLSARSEDAGAVEIHTMTMDDGVMRMRKINEIDLPAGETVALAPGGLHLMIMSPSPELSTSDETTITLTFEEAGDVDVVLPVRKD